MNYFSTRDLKTRAKNVIRRRLSAILLTSLAFMLVNYLLTYLSNELSGLNDWANEFARRLESYMDQLQNAATPEEMYAILEKLSMPSVSFYSRGVFAVVLSFLISLMSVPLSAGYVFHVLAEMRGHETKVTSIFSGFRVTLKALAISLLTGLLVALGSILFVIPGIVLMLRYSMAVFVLMDDPSKGPVQCMKESGRLMQGWKWNYFKLSFSFILWYLLSSLVTSFIGIPLLNLYLNPYVNLTSAAFYLDLLPASSGENWSPEIEF